MKKKQLTSILLAGIMILGLCIPAFADEGNGSEGESSTGGQSTNVEYTASNNESYLLTVPASLAPGGSDTVKLEGNWPSTRTMKVNADANVVLTNSINANDKKTLTISFNEIALAGNNNETVSATEEVSVQDITNANFGEWSGRFSYYVNSEGAGANEPVVEPINYQVPTMTASNGWYKSNEAKSTITSIQMVDSYTPTGNEDETWYADKDNGIVPETQITVYRTGTDIVIAGNGTGKIMANEDCSKMFASFTSLGYAEFSILDTSNTTNMTQMFYGYPGSRSLNVSNFDTSNVTSMAYMFFDCKNMNGVYVSNFDTSKVVYMNSMFKNCSYLTTLDLSGFDTANIDNMWSMFEGCSKLTSLDISSFNTAKTTITNSMFKGCSRLSSIYVGGGWDMSKVSNDSNMFSNCTSLPNFNLSAIGKTNAHTGEGGYLTLKT